jgi:hypothetical protein
MGSHKNNFASVGRDLSIVGEFKIGRELGNKSGLQRLLKSGGNADFGGLKL